MSIFFINISKETKKIRNSKNFERNYPCILSEDLNLIIREFLCIHESGTVLYHRKYQLSGNSTDIILRSGLISALYNYATEVENDAIDVLRMSKVSLFFKKREHPILFVLFVESSIDPRWCETEIDLLLERFFKKFPEVIWQREIVDLRLFENFDEDVDEILLGLGKKIDLLLFLVEDGLITEEEYLDEGLGALGARVGARMLDKTHELFNQALAQGENFLLAQIDKILSQLDGGHVQRLEHLYNLNCSQCHYCDYSGTECFFEEFLITILAHLGLDQRVQVRIQKD